MSPEQMIKQVSNFPENEFKTAKTVAEGAGVEAVFGLGAIVLSIMGLSNVSPHYTLTIAAISAGIAFLSQWVSVADRYEELATYLARNNRERTQITGGFGSEFAGGVAGIVLGILGLIGLVPAILIPVAAIIFGVTLLMSTEIIWEFRRFGSFVTTRRLVERVSQEALKVASGTQVLVGLGTVVLGILALIGLDWMTLVFVAMLAVGFATTVSGIAVGTKMVSNLKQ